MAKAKDDHWMEEAFSKNKGKLHKETGTPAGKKISAKKLKKAENSKNPTVRKEADLAATAKKINAKRKKGK
jgi:hypothetical protein